MANFMYIFWNPSGKTLKWPAKVMRERMQVWKEWTDSLAEGGRLLGGASLLPAGKVVRGPKKTVTDGPYAEGGDTIAGYMIISARNLSEAVKLSKDCPVLYGDWMVEIRPIRAK